MARAKKTSWYNSLYPSYKSRSEDFKKIFATLPSSERLIAGENYLIHDIDGNHKSMSYDCRILLCLAKGHFGARPTLRYSKLFVLLCQHFPLGNSTGFEVEGCQRIDQRKDSPGDSKRDPSMATMIALF